MAIPIEIQNTIERLNQELNQIEKKAQQGLNLLQPLINLFPNNNLLVQFYSYLNNALFLVQIYRKRVQMIIDLLLEENLSEETVQNSGEELGDLLGRAVESKVSLDQIISRLEKLQ
jgi:division protein CdvB (Snf7/Vps24/ESCRT-III family)